MDRRPPFHASFSHRINGRRAGEVGFDEDGFAPLISDHFRCRLTHLSIDVDTGNGSPLSCEQKTRRPASPGGRTRYHRVFPREPFHRLSPPSSIKVCPVI